MDATEAALYQGAVFAGQRDSYTLGAKIGDGGFAGVFEGNAHAGGREVAIKVLSFMKRPPNAVMEFEAEKALLWLLTDCSNVVTLLDEGDYTVNLQAAVGANMVAVTTQVPFIVLERAAGSLESELANRHSIPWERRLLLFREVVKGVHQMHLKRIVHRDVKAENALTFLHEPFAKVTDLGRSKDAGEPSRFPAPAYEVGKGDVRFAPTEFLWGLGTSDPLDQWRADLYHIGSLLYEIATATGITSVAVGDPRLVLAHAQRIGDQARRVRDFNQRIPELRDRYELAYEAFGQEVPPVIKVEAVALLRQLTDPDPLARVPVKSLGRLPIYWDLQWLFRRLDIMAKRLAADERKQSMLRHRRGRRKIGATKP